MKSIVRRWLAITALAMALGPSPVSLARGHGTPDGVPPADETSCDGLKGAAHGLCVAYCEANDCELDRDSEECGRLRANLEKITGSTSFPCDEQEK